MTEIEARDALNSILDSLGIQPGDCIMLGIDMSKIPLPSYEAEISREAFRERERKWCHFVLDVLLSRIGEDGTIIVPTFTYSCGKPGSIYNAQSSPSENGPFTEFFRTHPLAHRSIHPIFSLAAIGKASKHILNNVGRSAFGAMSPFSKFSNFEIRFLCLGVEIKNSITYIHHLEQNYGCPHRYNKTFDVTVLSEKKKIQGEWYAYVDYMTIDYSSDISSLQNELKKSNDLNEVNWNGQVNHLANIAAVDRAGYALLTMDSCTFVDKKLQLNFEEIGRAHV